jgi:hypothetical protein
MIIKRPFSPAACAHPVRPSRPWAPRATESHPQPRTRLLRKATGQHNISTRGFCFLPDEGGQHLFRKQPHLPVDLIDPLVAEQPDIPKGAHQMV